MNPPGQHRLKVLKSFAITALLFLITAAMAVAEPAPLTTSVNSSLYIPAYRLVTNGVVGLTNPAPRLMVNSVSSNSTKGGSVSLIANQAWSRWINNASFAGGLLFDDLGCLIFTGSIYDHNGTTDVATVKYSTNGIPLWTNRYDGALHGYDFARCLAIDRANNVYVGVDSDPYPHQGGAVLLKYSRWGVPLWTNQFNIGTNLVAMGGLAVDATGNSYILAVDWGTNRSSLICVKYNSSDTAIWTNRFNTTSYSEDFASDIKVDPAGNVFICGNTYGTYDGETYFTIKYAPNGTMLWIQRRKNSVAVPPALNIDRNGNVLVVGQIYTPVNNLPTLKYLAMKYLNNGTLVWTNAWPSASYLGGNVPLITSDLSGNVFTMGGSVTATNDNADFTTMKFNANGNVLWSRRFFETNYNHTSPAGIATDSAGNFYLAGHAGATNNSDYFTIKYGSNGSVQWKRRYDAWGIGDIAERIAVSANGNVAVTGVSGGWYSTVLYSNYILYKPATNFVGTDSFKFVVYDYLGRSATNTVNITVQ